ncbi:T9SS type A sorting domain-containing protein [Fluviicola taffensis]|uniref:Secretion system C-terminal sorting domain-containing protein n=1 Tax=Fluviicola taffensis (strain DSM 16823 / NCIMB 13979 / RW262) TaxID=755732 RepID=F2IAM7_FLUTR|nr:T9SS type A sorting domain-containing protein [Fluviicola taffensis]AEA44182.1 hypothetical protein Fluta_2196 [Fluviicola taffensis DSM 16823]
MKTVVLLGGLLLISSSLFAQISDPTEENQLPNWELKVYPNPTSDLLVISSSIEIKDVTLMDLNGQVIKKNALPNWCYSLQELPTGWIFVYIESTDGRVEKKNVYKN